MKPAKQQRPPQHGGAQVVGISQKTETSVTFSPLPAPELLEHYERIHPGTAERILKMAELEQEERHRQKQQLLEMERKNLRTMNWNVIRGQVLAFGSVLVVCAMCGYFAYLGKIEVAGDTAKWVIVSLAAVFITGRYWSRKRATDNNP